MKKLISLFIATIMLAGTFASMHVSAATVFSDVEADRWSAASVRYAVNKGYMNGVGGDLFDPEGSLTRAMVATVLWRRQGSPAPAAPGGFTDVPADEWYTDAVAWAKDAGVVRGLTETTFGPDEYITREQLATMLFRFSTNAPVSVPERADLEPFADDEKVSSWAEEPVEWAVEAKLINGTDGNRLDPEGYATREQFAAVIERYDDTFILKYNNPVIRSHYTEKEYPLVGGADIYVATDGDDENPGTFDKPLATFGGAVAKVREIKAAKAEGDIVVAFKAGTYGPVEAELTPEDGGSQDQRIIYCKYGDGEVVFDNGATVAEDEFEPISKEERSMFQEKHADRIKKVDLSSRIGEIPGFDDFALFGDAKYCYPARFPNIYENGSDQFMAAGETYDADTTLSTLFIFNPILSRRIASYSERMVKEMLLYGYIVRGFRKDVFTVESYDAENSLLTVGYGSSSEFGKKLRDGWRDANGLGIRTIVENVPYELDTPGEYWVDRQTGTLYVYAPEGNYHVPLPHGEKRLRGVVKYDTDDGYPASEGYCAVYAEDTGYLTFRGIHFTNNAGEFFMGFRTSGFEFDRCRFDRCTGRNQLLFEYSLPDAPLGLRVTDSNFDLCTGRHIYVFDEAGGPERFTNRSEILVDNCSFSYSNLVYDAEGAVNLHNCSGGLVSHNLFENCYRYAVMFTGSCDVTVEYNDFESAMINSDDGGVTRGCLDVIGNCVVRYNFYNSIADGGSVGRMAHYCDNCDCGTLMYSNLIFDGGEVVYHGAGRDNVLADNVMIGREVGSSCGSLTDTVVEDGEEKTIVSGTWISDLVVSNWRTVFTYAETVPGYAEALEQRRPGALSLSLDPDDIGNKNSVLAPTNTFKGNLFVNQKAEIKLNFGGNAADYCTVEGNVAYTFDENPVFVNPTIGDYRIRDGVDFPDIHFEEIGRY